MVEQKTYIIATIRPWNIINFYKNEDSSWFLLTRPEHLNCAILQPRNPRYIFFPHWSWIIPEEIYSKYECILFHMTDLPFGRGGSPLQNLISMGIYETQITAFKVGKGIDTGDVYMRRPLSFYGSAEEIYMRASDIIFDMMREIIETEPTPVPQEGEPTIFKRRKPEQSVITVETLPSLFDHIRMLDADGYPRAFLEHDEFKYEFSRASLKHDGLYADVRITEL